MGEQHCLLQAGAEKKKKKKACVTVSSGGPAGFYNWDPSWGRSVLSAFLVSTFVLTAQN